VKTNLENNKRKQREQKQLVRNQKTIETMKTRINQLVVVALFALLMLGGNVSAKGTELVALLIENWMVDANYWNTADANVELTDAAEEGLELENWMIDGKVWNTENSVVLENETEQELAIEAWMVDENIWN
jgi:hypothetical protein